MSSKQRSAELLKNSVFIGIGTIASRLIVFVLVPLYSMWLSPEDYGTFDLTVTYITLCVPFATLQLEQAIYVNCVSDYGDSRRYFTSALAIVLPLLCVVSVVITIIMGFILKLEYTGFFIFYFCSFALFNLITEYVRGQRKLAMYSLSNVSYAVLVFALSVLAVSYLKTGIDGMLASYGLAYLLVALVLIIKVKPIKPNLFSGSLLLEMLKFSIPLLPNSVSWWISNVSNRTFINLFLGTAANGLFAVSSKIPTIVSLLYGIFNLAFQQTAFDALHDEDRSEYFRTLFKLLVRILVTGCIVIVAFVPVFYWLAIDESYWDGMSCIPLLLGGAILLALAQFMGDILLAERKPVLIGGSTAIAAGVTIAFNALFVPIWGLNGAAFGSFAAYAGMFAMRLSSLRHHFDLKDAVMTVVSWMIVFGLVSLVIFGSLSNVYLYSFIVCGSIALFFFANKALLTKFLGILRKEK